MGCACIFFALEGYVYLEAPVSHKPLIISHRGVSDKKWCSKYRPIFRKDGSVISRFR